MSFQAMSFIFLLLLVFAYIFAVVGVILFQAYTRSDVWGLVYHDSFKCVTTNWKPLLSALKILYFFSLYSLLILLWRAAFPSQYSQGHYEFFHHTFHSFHSGSLVCHSGWYSKGSRDGPKHLWNLHNSLADYWCCYISQHFCRDSRFVFWCHINVPLHSMRKMTLIWSFFMTPL